MLLLNEYYINVKTVAFTFNVLDPNIFSVFHSSAIQVKYTNLPYLEINLHLCEMSFTPFLDILRLFCDTEGEMTIFKVALYGENRFDIDSLIRKAGAFNALRRIANIFSENKLVDGSVSLVVIRN